MGLKEIESGTYSLYSPASEKFQCSEGGTRKEKTATILNRSGFPEDDRA
jgi:hypothetical protein